MRKFVCRCGNRTFAVDENNAGRLVCSNCGKHYFWNGLAFCRTTRLQQAVSLVKTILRIEKKPPLLEPKPYGEAPARPPIKEKRKHMASKSPEKYMVPYKKPSKRPISWCKQWHDFIMTVVECKCVYVGKHQHIGRMRGKGIIKEAHRRFNLLGLKSSVDFNKGRICFLGDERKAKEALQAIAVRR